MAQKKQPNYRLNGANPLSYLGVNPSTPPQTTIQGMSPQPNNVNFDVGTIWLVRNPIGIWMLTSVSGGVATWIPLFPNGGSGATTFPCNSGTATEVGGVLNVLGVNVLNTTGGGNTVAINLINGANGQVLIGGGAHPVWANITSTGATIAITNGPNSINLEASGGSGASSFPTNSGTAIPAAGVLNIYGDTTLITTSAAGNTVTASMVQATNGKIPIAATGSPTLYANITSLDSSVTITNGPNSIDLSTAGSSGPATCNFFYYQPSNSGTLTTPGPWYLGAVVAMTKIFDVGNNVTPGNGAGTSAVFTAPVDGVYLLGCCITCPTASTQFNGFIQTSAGTFAMPSAGSGGVGSTLAVLVKLTAAQTSQFGIQNLTTSLTISGGTTPYYTYFWGYLVTTA